MDAATIVALLSTFTAALTAVLAFFRDRARARLDARTKSSEATLQGLEEMRAWYEGIIANLRADVIREREEVTALRKREEEWEAQVAALRESEMIHRGAVIELEERLRKKINGGGEGA